MRTVAFESYYRLNLTTYYYWTMDITLPSDSYYRLNLTLYYYWTMDITLPSDSYSLLHVSSISQSVFVETPL